MIGRVSNNTGASPAADLTPKAASTKVLCRTPFGDVMVDELSTRNVASILLGGRSDQRSAPAVGQPAALASTEPAAATASTAQSASTSATQPAEPTAQAVPDDAQEQDAFPTAQSVFGDNPWITNPTGTAPDGSTYGYNPLYFATPATAAKVAEMVGGKVVASDQIASLGGFINAGLVASFYIHGFSQSYIDHMIQNEIQGA